MLQGVAYDPINPYNKYIHHNTNMSTLHHESILEDCYLEILEEFRTDLLFMSQEQIDKMVYERFESRCQ